jgi:voltage-gated potassium channel
MLRWLRVTVFKTDTRSGRIFDLSIQFLILLSLVSFSLETLSGLDERTRLVLGQIETVTVVLFSREYLLRLVLSSNRLRYVFSVFGIIDLAAILPFYLTTGIDLRSLRALRLLRIVRAFKLLRYGQALDRFKNALLQVREELMLFFGATILVLYLAAVGIYYFEKDAQPEVYASIFHSLWWAVATLTTVGYGDVYPITAGGRCFTFIILMVGLGVVAIPSGLMASALTDSRKKPEIDSPDIQEENT